MCNELVKLSDSIAEYTDNVQRLNEALNKSDELRADAVDVMNVLNGNYNDSAAVLMAYKLNMISLEDVEKTRWGNLRALEIAAADTHKNTIFGVLGENESFHKKIEESQDVYTKNLIDNLAVNQETLKSNTSSVRENTDELNKNIYSGQESLEQSLINRLAINKNTTKESVESTTKAIEDETPNLEKAGEDASDAIEKSFEDVDLEEQGGNIILGLLKGFWNNSILAKIGKAVGNVSQSIYNAFTSWWDMHSPAKKSGPLGKNIVLGIPPGMLSEKKAVEQAGEEINEAIYSSLQTDRLTQQRALELINTQYPSLHEFFTNDEQLSPDDYMPYSLPQSQILTEYNVTHTHDFKQSAELKAMRNDIRDLNARMDALAKRPINLYLDGRTFVGSTIQETDRQLGELAFKRNMGV